MPKAKQTIYLETSVISAYFDFKKQDPIREAITREFWQEVLPFYQMFLGTIALLELDALEKKYKVKVIDFVSGIPELKISPKIEEVVDLYFKYNIFPKVKRPDAVHVAVASVNKIDFLVSWNQEHITRPHRTKIIQDFNLKHKLFVPEITTPEALLLSQREENKEL
ncbi:hypothetical protein KKD20_01150 [Patescibacteria group bacterium]|nr:hypothetical protein [Patescibacteria group bacterium]